MVPRGADAVVMVEHATIDRDALVVYRPVAPGSGISFAGTDMARGELVLRRGARLSSRETGVLAAIGRGEVGVVRRPRVAILSTGDEIIAPGVPHRAGGGLRLERDHARRRRPRARGRAGARSASSATTNGRSRRRSTAALGCDLVLLSGGTSKGAGDLSYRTLARREPGIVVHGVALKPGKPICLGAVGATPVAILPGFPTSAIFTFHEFIAPLIRRLAGLRAEAREAIAARMPARFNSEVGRTEYLLVNLVDGPRGLSAYPMGKGSGSVTTFSRADGFVVIPRSQEYVEAGEAVSVVPLGRGTAPADLVSIGSHCVGARPPARPARRGGVHEQDALGRLAGRPGRRGAGRVRRRGRPPARPAHRHV